MPECQTVSYIIAVVGNFPMANWENKLGWVKGHEPPATP